MERSLGVIGERVERLAAQAARLAVGASPERGRSITARAAQVQANFRELKVCLFVRRLHREIPYRRVVGFDWKQTNTNKYCTVKQNCLSRSTVRHIRVHTRILYTCTIHK